MSGSVWLETAPLAPSHPRLDRDLHADVCVVGGGIVGVTTALLLHEAGLHVVLVEADGIGHGVTGHTTAKVTSQHGLIYARLRSEHGPAAARLYASANEGALTWMTDRIARDGIDCDLRRRAAYVYASDRSQITRELNAALGAELPAALVDTTPLPYAVGAAMRFDDQAELHAQKYLLALAAQLPEIYEGTRAVQVGDAVRTPGGMIHARHTILATHYPFPDRSLAFARLHPQRSYAIVCRIEGAPPDGMFISGEEPTRSVRGVPVAGEELLLVGGEGHKTGTGGDTTRRYAALEAFAREHWDVRSVDYRWSAQDNTTVDGLPFVGRLTPWEPRVLMATGFAKWGMTNGTAAAMVLRDLVLGHDNPYAALVDPIRLNVRASLPALLKENAQVAARFAGDRLGKPGRRDISELEPGEGDIVNLDGERVAGYRDADGALTAVSPVCSHLGCQVNFNRAERSWDCPCHGSRFAVDGTVLQGPAVHRLERKPL